MMSEAVTALPACLLIFMLFLDAVFGGFVSVTERTYPSPNGAYAAEMHISDESAPGGSTTTAVYEKASDVPFCFGGLRCPMSEYHGGWCAPYKTDIYWENDDTVHINCYAWNRREGDTER